MAGSACEVFSVSGWCFSTAVTWRRMFIISSDAILYGASAGSKQLMSNAQPEHWTTHHYVHRFFAA